MIERDRQEDAHAKNTREARLPLCLECTLNAKETEEQRTQRVRYRGGYMYRSLPSHITHTHTHRWGALPNPHPPSPFPEIACSISSIDRVCVSHPPYSKLHIQQGLTHFVYTV